MSLTLRRSVWGSLRSASPFTSPLAPLTNETSPEKPEKMASAVQSRPFGRIKRANSSFKYGKQTPVVPRIAKTITMTAFDIEGRPPPPELDREVDLVACIELSDHLKPFFTILASVQLISDTTEHCYSLFGLPLNVKYLIYSFCFPEERRKITLSPRFATKAVFDDGYFASPWRILDPVRGGLSASSILRTDLLTYFWTEYHFHVSISTFSAPKFSPLTFAWLPQYLGIVQHLTIEIDLTRFGGSALKQAHSLGYGCEKLEQLAVDLIHGLQQRTNNLQMAELAILCRKYLGQRPVDGVYVTEEDVPWHPAKLPLLLKAIPGLRGIIQKCEVAGFSSKYSRQLLNSLFSDEASPAELMEPKDSPWPTLPLYEPLIRAPTACNTYAALISNEYDSASDATTRCANNGTDDQPGTPNSGYTNSPVVNNFSTSLSFGTDGNDSDWELPLQHSTSFTDMFEREVKKSENFLLSIQAGRESLENTDIATTFPKLNEQNLKDQVLEHQSIQPQTTISGTSTARNSPQTLKVRPRSYSRSEPGNTLTKSSLHASNLFLIRKSTDTSRPLPSLPKLSSDLKIPSPPPQNAELAHPRPLPPTPKQPSALKIPKPRAFSRQSFDTSRPLPRLPRSVSTLQTPRSFINNKSKLAPPAAIVYPVTPTPASKKGIMPSVSTMNALNEQDPAFIRTMTALRSRVGGATAITERGFVDGQRSKSVMLVRETVAESMVVGDTVECKRQGELERERCVSSMSYRTGGGAGGTGGKKRCKDIWRSVRGGWSA